MEYIRWAMVQVMKYILIGAAVPVIALFVIAAYNQRVRRILLWLLTPLAAVSVVAFFIFAPQRFATVEDWSQGLAALKDSLITALPYLLGLAVIMLVAYLLGPVLRRGIEGGLHNRARSEYLDALLAWVDGRLAGTVDLEGQELPPGFELPQRGVMRISGAVGAGKTTLLARLLREAARRAQADESAPLPLWLDLDDLLAAPDGEGFQLPEAVTPVQVRYLKGLLRSHAKQERLMFFIDGSVESYAKTFAVMGLPDAAGAPAASKKKAAQSGEEAPRTAAGQLAKLIDTMAPCPFVLAMPPHVEDGTLNHLIETEIVVPPLSEAGMWAGMAALAVKNPAAKASETTGSAEEALRSGRTVWRALAMRPVFLARLAQFYARTGHMPSDARELFRRTVYPPKIPAERVESRLVWLAENIARTGRYAQPLSELEAVLVTSADKTPDPAQAIQTVQALAKARMIRVLPANREIGREQALVCFAHPILLAYFTALDWLHGDGQRQMGFFQPQGDGGTSLMEKLQGDPVLADALMFFTNMHSDPEYLGEVLTGLAADPGLGRFLAAEFLLAMPAEERPLEATGKVIAGLVETAAEQKSAAYQAAEWAGADGYTPGNDWSAEAGTQADRLLEAMEPAAKMQIYTQAFAGLEAARLEQVVDWLADGDQAGLCEALWRAPEPFSRRVGEAWAAAAPRKAAGPFLEFATHGPQERRGLAVDLLGRLPREVVEGPLAEMYEAEREPAARAAILRSQAASGNDQPLRLLEIITDRQEADEVRSCAAELLAHSRGPEVVSSGVVREVVRASRLPLPVEAHTHITRLLDALRRDVPEEVMHWEEMANPYVVGRPVAEPPGFVGREALLLDLRAAVENAGPVLVTGERGIGKTSLLLRLAGILENEAARGVPVRVAFLDLEGLEPHEFYETAIRALIEGLRDPDLVADSNVPRPYTDQPFARDLGDVLDYLRGKHGPYSRLALLIDAADGFLNYPAAMHAAMRRVFSGAARNGLALVLAGTDPLQGWPHEQPPFYADFARFDLNCLTPDEAAQLVTGPAAGMLDYEPGAVQQIVQAAQARPNEIQALCQRVAARALARGERAITAEMVMQTGVTGPLPGAPSAERTGFTGSLAGKGGVTGPLIKEETGPRADLITQASSVLGEMMDWVTAHPDAPPTQVEEQLKRAWAQLQKAMVQQVVKARGKRG